MEKVTQRHLFKPLAIVALMTGSLLYAGAQGMFGISYSWGDTIGLGNLGFSMKIISNDKKTE